ncbi:MAG TPA: hypothetical protein PK250_12920 [Syntrophobacter fumaroxidans]|nr:hypothetical protein [Syntrophobacter fumaroxidans]
MKCPVEGCGFHVFKSWEAEIPSRLNFTGVYECPRHGLLKASGRYDPKTREKTILHYHLACPEHGTDTVVKGADGIHVCMVCHRSMTADDVAKRIHRGPLPDSDRAEPVTWQNTILMMQEQK